MNTTHTTTCRAHAIGCAVENLRDAKADPIVAAWAATASPVDEGDRYLAEGLASCLCGTDATWAASWVLLGLAALDEAPAAPAVYTVAPGLQGVQFASTDLEAAKAWAQAWADARAVARPWEATPHVVVQTWHGADTAWTEDVHVYAAKAAEAPEAAPVDEAETMRRVTGSVSAIVRHEHVAADGTVVVDSEATSYATAPRGFCDKCGAGVEDLGGTIGWVDVVSGDDGGTYDVCTEGGRHVVGGL
jgi:hypothetical protein